MGWFVRQLLERSGSIGIIVFDKIRFMADTLSPEKRSWNMSLIRSKNTKPERYVRSILHRSGYRFSLHSALLAGKPDIILRKYRTVIFVHGCFWHRHANCYDATTPKTNRKFWLNKFKGNAKRDNAARNKLSRTGWKVIRVWECELKKPLKLKKRICTLLIKRLDSIKRGPLST